MEQLPAIGAAVGASAGAAWLAFQRVTKRREKRSHDVVTAVAAQTEIYASMQQILAETDAQRCILLKAHNGGRVLENVATQLYVTIFAEIAVGGVESVQQDFQTRPLYDPKYLNLLRQTQAAKSVQIWLKDMEEDEMLHGVYTNAGIATSVVTEVWSSPGRYWYMSTSWGDDHEATSAERATIAAAANKMRGLLQKDLFG